MNAAISAGLLMYKFDGEKIKVFLVHPGGPFFKNKDDGYWSIPKGLVEKVEEILNTAIREFKEETGIEPIGEYNSLGWVKKKSGKTIHAWAFEYFGDNDIKILSNKFEGALLPIELANKIASISTYPSAKSLQLFADAMKGTS